MTRLTKWRGNGLKNKNVQHSPEKIKQTQKGVFKMTNVYTTINKGDSIKIKMTVPYLKQLLKSNGHTGYSRYNKEGLLNAAINHDLLEWDSFLDAYVESSHEIKYDPETITLYHGTNEDYETFEDKESTYSHGGNEGAGIYFTESEEFAASYGEYIHKIEVRKSDVHDFVNPDNLTTYMLEILSAAGRELGIENIFEEIYESAALIALVNQFKQANEGFSRISDLYEDSLNILDSFESTQRVVESFGETQFFDTVERVFKDNLKPVFKYNDNDFKGIPMYITKNADRLNSRMVTKIIYKRK